MLIALFLANLPVRWWGPFEDRFPVRRMASAAGLLTMIAGVGLAIRGYLRFVEVAADGTNRAILAAQSDLAQVPGWALLALPAFLLATPTGLLALYLTTSGFFRGAAAFLTDEVSGDYLLTGADALVRSAVGRASRRSRLRNRERAEGAPVPDRVVAGKQIGRPEFALVLLASRAKPDWAPGSYLVGGDGSAYRIGPAFDFASSGGLRTAYPLTVLDTLEPIRHAIPYDLPRK